jgi:6-pyruvoyltetrahydropterin/6-carboxytetrahydropterin synthase
MARNPLDGRKIMYRLRVKSEFDAAHKMDGYIGKCSQLHGHTYTVEAFLLAKNLDKLGISVDLRALKQKLQDIIEQFDHSYLNDFKELGAPSTENLAQYIFGKMKISLPDGVTLEKVRVWETPKSWIEYFEG